MGSRLEKNSSQVRKRIDSHTFSDEQGEEYKASTFGGFGDYMRRKKIKLQNLDVELREQSAGNPIIFKGIVVHVNGYTQPSLSDLHKLVVTHGGGFLQYLDGKTAVTHVVASSLTPKKRVEFARYRIVKPAWIVDSVKAGKLLPWDNYRVVDEGLGQKVIGFENGSVVSQASTYKQGYRDQSDSSWYTSHVQDFAQQVNAGSDFTQANTQQINPFHSEIDEVAVPPVQSASDDPHDGNRALTSELFEDQDQDFEEIHAEGVTTPSNVEPNPEAQPESLTGDEEIRRMWTKPLPDPTTYFEPRAITESSKSGDKKVLSAEEHNAILLQNPHLAKSSTANPDFLNQYYRESRLHHLSTWKANLKALLQARAQEKSATIQRQKRDPMARRYIMHVDFDSFFAAVSLRRNPHLADKPVVIAHGSGPGSEIASCNYPARKFGVKNGMWMKSALVLCPDLKVLPYDYKLYEEASRHFYDSILAVDGIVQSISIDEALVDISEQCIKAGSTDGKAIREGSIYREQAKAEELARHVRDAVREKTGCEVSVGLGNNILLAKVALRKAKPAGQHLIKPDDILDFVGELVVTDLPGVAWSIGKKLEEIGVKYVKDIRSLNKERLITTLGPKTGEKIWDYARGIDRQEVGDQVVRKSVSAEVNWGIRFVTQQQAEEFVQSLCDELSRRLLEQTVKGKQLTMKIMRKAADAGMDPPKSLGHGKCDTFNKSVVLGVATHDRSVLGKEAISILRSYGFPPGELRGLGVQMQKLEPIKPPPVETPPLLDSSQRRLQFRKPDVSTVSINQEPMRATLHSPVPEPKPRRLRDTIDPIDDIPTPKKETAQISIKGALEAAADVESEAINKPLNISGTQFIMPTQVDPAVLRALPADIRAKLAPKQRSLVESVARSVSPQTDPGSRSASPYLSDGDFALPNQSQVDPSVLSELPDDVKQELLSHYRNKSKSVSKPIQPILPQSPRKLRTAPASKKLTPTKKNKFSSVLGKSRAKPMTGGSTLTQSNFLAVPRAGLGVAASEVDLNEGVSQSFLDELPEDIKLEILAEQKRQRMKSRSGLNVGTTRKKVRVVQVDDVGRGQQTLHLAPAPTKPTFTSRKLSTLSDLRESLTAWVDEFSQEGEAGPFDEDVDALGHYLGRVVAEEHDISKAASLIEWWNYLVDSLPIEKDQLRSSWLRSISSVVQTLQTAARARGLPPLHLEGF